MVASSGDDSEQVHIGSRILEPYLELLQLLSVLDFLIAMLQNCQDYNA